MDNFLGPNHRLEVAVPVYKALNTNQYQQLTNLGENRSSRWSKSSENLSSCDCHGCYIINIACLSHSAKAAHKLTRDVTTDSLVYITDLEQSAVSE